MSEPFLGEIKIISWNFAPKGWAFTNGQFLPINQNQALFSLLGTTYGGNGQTTFALPDFRGKVPVHVGNGQTLGQAGGESSHTLTMSEMAMHQHVGQAATSDGNVAVPGSNLLARSASALYIQPGNLTPMSAPTVSNVGGSQPHNNMQPYLVLNFIIALIGIFPSQN
jgi:microcystin-dependent protein